MQCQSSSPICTWHSDFQNSFNTIYNSRMARKIDDYLCRNNLLNINIKNFHWRNFCVFYRCSLISLLIRNLSDSIQNNLNVWKKFSKMKYMKCFQNMGKGIPSFLYPGRLNLMKTIVTSSLRDLLHGEIFVCSALFGIFSDKVRINLF